eukprot:6625601-Karenia_brevis.AAC.1
MAAIRAQQRFKVVDMERAFGAHKQACGPGMADLELTTSCDKPVTIILRSFYTYTCRRPACCGINVMLTHCARRLSRD